MVYSTGGVVTFLKSLRLLVLRCSWSVLIYLSMSLLVREDSCLIFCNNTHRHCQLVIEHFLTVKWPIILVSAYLQ